MKLKLNGLFRAGKVVLLGCLVILMSHCGRQGSDSSKDTSFLRHLKSILFKADSGTFKSVYEVTLSTACIECHKPGSSAWNDSGVKLDFSSEDKAFDSLKDKAVTGRVGRQSCKDVKVVKSGDTKNSYILPVLFADYLYDDFGGVSGCVPFSHRDDQNLSGDEKKSMVDWIKNGAERTGLGKAKKK